MKEILLSLKMWGFFPLLFNTGMRKKQWLPKISPSIPAKEWGFGMQHHPAGCSPISHGPGAFLGGLSLSLFCLYPWEEWLLVGWTPSAACLGAAGGCGAPFPGIFVPQPLEATGALCSRQIYSGRTFGHTLAPKSLKWASPQRQQSWAKAGQGGALSSVAVSRDIPTGNRDTFPKSGRATELPRLVLSTGRNFVCPTPN